MSQADNLAALGSNVNASGVLQPASGGTGVTTSTGTGSVVLSSGATLTNATINGAVASGFTLKNRIINGDMVISQRGTSFSSLGSQTYTLDRWVCDRFGGAATATVTQSSTAPTGFINSLLYTVGTGAATGATDYSNARQYIEGLNVADLGWGTASAKTVTLSFWVRSSVTGTYGVAFTNNGYDRNYIASYTISSANTWEQKTITIAGDTSGTWLTTNGTGIRVIWDLGVGSTYSGAAGSWGSTYAIFGLTGGVKLTVTSGATFYVTGVQLEQGSQATSFEWIPYGLEFDLCRRYCEVYSNPNLNYDQDGFPQAIQAVDVGGRGETLITYYPKRASPTITTLNNNLFWQNMANTGSTCTFAGTYVGTGIIAAPVFLTVSGACAVGALSGVGSLIFTNVANKIIISAEL